jgi:hypothetical protein
MLVILFVLTKTSEPDLRSSFSFSDPLALTSCVIAVGIFVLAIKLPGLMRAGPGQPVGTQNLLVPYLIRMSLFEAIAIVGFVVAVIKLSVSVYLPFLFIALAGFLISPPSKSLLLKLSGKN